MARKSALLGATFQGARTVQLPTSTYTVYVLSVAGDGRRWLVFRRYREWHRLHERLVALYTNVPPIPPKTLLSIFGPMSPPVVDARSRGLQAFLEASLAHAEIRASELFAAFLADEGEIKGLQMLADDLHEFALAGGQHADASAASEQRTNSEMAERVADAFIDLRDGSEPLEPVAMEHRRACHAPVIARALARRVPLSSRAPDAPSAATGAAGLEAAMERLGALAARPPPSAAERLLAKLAADALADALNKSGALSAPTDLLVKVP